MQKDMETGKTSLTPSRSQRKIFFDGRPFKGHLKILLRENAGLRLGQNYVGSLKIFQVMEVKNMSVSNDRNKIKSDRIP